MFKTVSYRLLILFYKSKGKYEMKVHGPFDVYGKKIPMVTRNEIKSSMKNIDYNHLSDEDKVKVSQQINREQVMEDARESYDSKYIPPTNRAYKNPPSYLKSDEVNGLRRPLVRVNIPRYANKSVVLTNILPGSKKTLSIKLPVNVSLETVLKNIYDHMYEYYFHKKPSSSDTKEELAARKVIQDLISKDMKNISNYVYTKNEILKGNDENSLKVSENFELKNDLPAYAQPNTIVEPSEENPIEPFQINFSNKNSSIVAADSGSTEVEKGIEQISSKVEDPDSISVTSAQSDHGILSPDDQSSSDMKDAEQGITRSNLPRHPEIQPYAIKLRGSLESNIKTLEYIQENNLLSNENKELANTLLSLPLSAIAEEHAKKSSLGRSSSVSLPIQINSNYIQSRVISNFINSSAFEDSGNPNEVRNDIRTLPKIILTPFRAQPLPKPSQPLKHGIKDFMPPISNDANYFLIDTTGVSRNKPMVIETVAEYLEKQNSRLKKNQHDAKFKGALNMLSQEPLVAKYISSGTKTATKTESGNKKELFSALGQNKQQLPAQNFKFLLNQQQVHPQFYSHEIRTDSPTTQLVLNPKVVPQSLNYLNGKNIPEIDTHLSQINGFGLGNMADNVEDNKLNNKLLEHDQGSESTDLSYAAHKDIQNANSFPISSLQSSEATFLNDSSNRLGGESAETSLYNNENLNNKDEGVLIGSPRKIENFAIEEKQRPFKNADEFFSNNPNTLKNAGHDNERPSNYKISIGSPLFKDSVRYKGSAYTLEEELNETERKFGKAKENSENMDAQWDKKVFVPSGSDENTISKKSYIPHNKIVTNEQILDQRNQIMRQKLVLMKRTNEEDEYKVSDKVKRNTNESSLIKTKLTSKVMFRKNKMLLELRHRQNILKKSGHLRILLKNDGQKFNKRKKLYKQEEALGNQTNKYVEPKFNNSLEILEKQIIKDLLQVGNRTLRGSSNRQRIKTRAQTHEKKQTIFELKNSIKKDNIGHVDALHKKKIKKTDKKPFIAKENSEFQNFTFNPKKKLIAKLFDDSDMGQMLPMENEDYGLAASLEPEKKVITKTSDISERVK